MTGHLIGFGQSLGFHSAEDHHLGRARFAYSVYQSLVLCLLIETFQRIALHRKLGDPSGTASKTRNKSAFPELFFGRAFPHSLKHTPSLCLNCEVFLPFRGSVSPYRGEGFIPAHKKVTLAPLARSHREKTVLRLIKISFYIIVERTSVQIRQSSNDLSVAAYPNTTGKVRPRKTPTRPEHATSLRGRKFWIPP
jgi:hypothetical protein